MAKLFKLMNKSRQRRDVPLFKNGEVLTTPVLKNNSIEISEDQITESLRNMLKHPKMFGLKLIEAGEAPEPDPRDLVKSVMVKMIEDGDNLGVDGKPNVPALRERMEEADISFSVNADLRDELYNEIMT